MSQDICIIPHRYQDGPTELEGLVVRDAQIKGPQPGVLLIHEYTGLGDYLVPHAEALAREGFMVLCHDMYGVGVRPKDRAEASAISRPFRDDRMLMRSRAKAGLDALATLPGVDTKSLYAVGFSFGGGAVLELARSRAQLHAAVSFYGYLDTTHPANPGDIKAKLLVLHGMQDKVVTMDHLGMFEGEMDLAGADVKTVVYPHAGHAFSNFSAQPDPASGSFPCREAHEDAWNEMLRLFQSCLD
ncbi:dienelactone hydrolase family protein [Desulfovibrio ferrophilus]|uniref:Dienelactone hydrolase n=1 Tax=Desulfovibrio ferrophilus TaxID=241368 RepID=A0A2Z6AX54_9BACT|nr:dienelactone hydrolase family protein [Desulfovibrio ferrophilus]BBD07837.1 dienelactone hydrolase [Desulfovibrio ferrophilus]